MNALITSDPMITRDHTTQRRHDVHEGNDQPAMQTTASRRAGLYLKGLGVLAALVALSACSSAPKNITLADGAPTQTMQDAVDEGVNVPTTPVRYALTKPQCTGQCPSIEVDSIVVVDQPKLSQLIDHVLAYMTGVDADRRGNYQTLKEYEAYFWQTAQSRDTTSFKARIRSNQAGLITAQVDTSQYLTGAAHGIAATQFLNWDRERQRVVALSEALLPGQQGAYLVALQRAHLRWKQNSEDYQRDPSTYDRMWPFQPSDNFALTRHGLVVKYDAYAIAPYSAGQPELVIPYAELTGILDPKWIPSGR